MSQISEPWEVVLHFADEAKDDGYWIRGEISRNWIARVHRWNGAPRSPDATSKANAYMLAAAPEMLIALELYEAWAALPADRGGKDGAKGLAYAAFIHAKNAALAKAKPTLPKGPHQ